jgi:hypothetical protein
MPVPKLLYHYCSSQTGFSILQGRTFRLSALSAANDSLEGRLLGSAFADLLADTELAPEVADIASILVESYADTTEGFAFCLSEKADLLSQWRAYGWDGSGISLGFSSEGLCRDLGEVKFGADFYELTKVEYGEASLRQRLKPFVDEVAAEFTKYGRFIQLEDGISKDRALTKMTNGLSGFKGLFRGRQDNAIDLLGRLHEMLTPLHFQIYGIKPESFHEECEWRLLRYRHRADLPDIEYFADSNSVRPYISCLLAGAATEAIREVVLGPTHRSNIDWMRAFLASVGLSHVVVKRSAIQSYR